MSDSSRDQSRGSTGSLSSSITSIPDLPSPKMLNSIRQPAFRRDGRVAEGARLESVFRGNSNVGSNPTLSAIRINSFCKLLPRENHHKSSKREPFQRTFFLLRCDCLLRRERAIRSFTPRDGLQYSTLSLAGTIQREVSAQETPLAASAMIDPRSTAPAWPATNAAAPTAACGYDPSFALHGF